MTEEINHCDVAVDTPVKDDISTVETYSDEILENDVESPLPRRPQELLIEDQPADSNADVESNADSEEVDSHAHQAFSDIHEEESKVKLLGSPLTALTFPPPPPVEEEFEEIPNDAFTESSYSFDEADLTTTVDEIVRAAIKEAVMVETIVSVAMKEAVDSIISLIHQLQQQETDRAKKEDGEATCTHADVQNDKPEAEVLHEDEINESRSELSHEDDQSNKSEAEVPYDDEQNNKVRAEVSHEDEQNNKPGAELSRENDENNKPGAELSREDDENNKPVAEMLQKGKQDNQPEAEVSQYVDEQINESRSDLLHEDEQNNVSRLEVSNEDTRNINLHENEQNNESGSELPSKDERNQKSEAEAAHDDARNKKLELSHEDVQSNQPGAEVSQDNEQYNQSKSEVLHENVRSNESGSEKGTLEQKSETDKYKTSETSAESKTPPQNSSPEIKMAVTPQTPKDSELENCSNTGIDEHSNKDVSQENDAAKLAVNSKSDKVDINSSAAKSQEEIGVMPTTSNEQSVNVAKLQANDHSEAEPFSEEPKKSHSCCIII